MAALNQTHDITLKSWVESANGPDCHFPIQNLPFCVFSCELAPNPRVGVAIGDYILDLSVLESALLLSLTPAGPVFDRGSLNAFMATGATNWSRTRAALSTLLAADTPTLRDNTALRARTLAPLTSATLHLPFTVTEYTDFYASKNHATNVGSMFRDPANALLPNWSHMPVGYNGRASSVVVSGTDFLRPMGQIKPPDQDAPVIAPSAKLDFELEVGAIVGNSSALGTRLSVSQAEDAIFGYVLLNDWSARDIQQWEYVPLGPFQGKAFATSISPFIVTSEALAPFRITGPVQSPEPLPYLSQPENMNIDLHLEAWLQPDGTSRATRLCKTNFKTMYWSTAQQIAHHSASGCAMRIGDLIGSGTISGSEPGSYGSLLELAWNGTKPVQLNEGGTRCFIEDFDQVTLTGWCQRHASIANAGYRIGFGMVTGQVLPARATCIAS